MIVVNELNEYVTAVLVVDAKPLFYDLKDGERLIDAPSPSFKAHAGHYGLLRPKWNGQKWEESATPVEISAWEAEHPDPFAKTLDEIKSERQAENKAALAAWLASHPLTWTDGKRYGVEEQDQNELALNLMQYQVNKAAGQPAMLEWHAQKEECRPFEEAEYTALSMAISAYVYPYRRYQEKVKAAIYGAQTAEEVEAVAIDYAGVIMEKGDADA